MHPSGRGFASRDKGLAEAKHEVGVFELYFPERKVTKPKHPLGLCIDSLLLFTNRTALGVRHNTVEQGDILAGV